MSRIALLGPLLALASASATAPPSPLPNVPVPALDLPRYGGEWHEIAHLPMFFQRKCVANITATYRLNSDGTVGVRNACDKADGTRMASDGTARVLPGQPGRLQVRFAPDWLAWIPMVWADYWVVDLDPEYRWAVVGGPSREYLWILARTPTMARPDFEAIRERAARRGYAVDALVLPRGTLE